MTSAGDFLKILLFTLALAAWGCCTVPTGQFKALADSAAQLSQSETQAYNQSVDVERAWVVITQKSGALNEQSFDLESAFDPAAGEHPLGDRDLGARLEANGAALSAVSKYLTALSSFAAKDFQSSIDTDATKLEGDVSSLSSFSEPWAKDAGKSSGVLATVIDGLGHAYTESQRADTLKIAMNSAQTPLEQLASFVQQNNSTVSNVLKQVKTYYIQDASLLRPHPPGAERLEFDSNVAQVIGQFSDAQKTLTGLDSAVAKLPNAHAELAQSLCSQNSSLDNLKALVGEAERLNKFYKSAK
jgi:hypothetical protein